MRFATAAISEMLLLGASSHTSLVRLATAAMFEMVLSPIRSSVSLVKPATAAISDIEFSRRYRWVRLVNPATADTFAIEFSLRRRCVRLVSPATADISVMALPHRYRRVSLVRLATAAMSEMLLSQSCSSVRLVAVSSPVRSLMEASCAAREVSVAISAAEMGSPDVLTSADSILARRMASGMYVVTGVFPLSASSSISHEPLASFSGNQGIRLAINRCILDLQASARGKKQKVSTAVTENRKLGIGARVGATLPGAITSPT